MNIIQVVNTLSVNDGGPARNAFELNAALNGLERTESTLFWLRGAFKDSILASETSESLAQARLCRLSFSGNVERRLAHPLEVFRLLKASDIVIIHGYFLYWVPVLCLVFRFLRIPYVITPHGSLTARQQAISRTKKRIYEATSGWCVRRGLSSFVTGSAVEAEELSQKFPAQAIAVGGVGVVLPSKFKMNDALHSPVKLLSVSRIAEKKRLDISIRSVAVLLERGWDVTLTIAGVGSNDLTRRLQELGRELGVEDKVDFVGQVVGQEKQDLFCESDVFLLPSDDENFGIGFAEAMAYGLPSVVSKKVASATDMPVEVGVLLDGPTPDSVADAVIEVISGQELATSQRVARSFAETAFSWPSVAGKWRRTLSEHSKHSED